MKIATWNVNSLNVRLPQVTKWLSLHHPDILVLQELKLDQDKFPIEAIQATGFQAAWYGQKTYNGVAIISRHRIQDVVYGIPGFDDEQKRVITATINGIRIINVYCVNGESLESDKFIYKKTWFAALTQYIQTELSQYNQLIVLGDFNIAPSNNDVYDPIAWQGKILCSSDEREWFQKLLNLGLTDSLRAIDPDQHHYTWWDYRMNMFRRRLGLRIDHILISQTLHHLLDDVSVDIEARAWERPSDHAPVTAIFRSDMR